MKCPHCGKKNTEPVPPRNKRKKQHMTWYVCQRCGVKYGQKGQ